MSQNVESIVVEVSGGVVQAVNIPPALKELGVQVEVWDYDVDNVDERWLDTNERGEGFVRAVY